MVTFDIASLLPEPARAKFVALRDRSQDRLAASRHAATLVEDARTDLANARISLTLYERQMVNRTVEQQNRLQAAITAAEELARRAANYDPRAKASQSIGMLVTRIERYLSNISNGTKITLFTGSVPKRKGSPAEVIAAARTEIDALTQRITDISLAPFPLAETEARIEIAVRELAARGSPDIDGILAGGSELAWPTETELAGPNAFMLMDTPAMMAWLFEEKMTAKLIEMVREDTDDAGAIASAARPKMLTSLREQILELGRVEENAIEDADKGGAEIARRPDADVRAVLGLSSALPPAPRD